MADKCPRTPERAFQRCFEPSRLQEELWALAYERIWPVLRKPSQAHAQKRGHDRASRSTPLARRA